MRLRGSPRQAAPERREQSMAVEICSRASISDQVRGDGGRRLGWLRGFQKWSFLDLESFSHWDGRKDLWTCGGKGWRRYSGRSAGFPTARSSVDDTCSGQEHMRRGPRQRKPIRSTCNLQRPCLVRQTTSCNSSRHLIGNSLPPSRIGCPSAASGEQHHSSSRPEQTPGWLFAWAALSSGEFQVASPLSAPLACPTAKFCGFWAAMSLGVALCRVVIPAAPAFP